MIRTFLAASALAGAAQALAQSGVSLELGRGEDKSDLARFGVVSDWGQKASLGEDWNLGGYWEFAAGGWQNGERIIALSATPVFRLERAATHIAPYVEAAIGLHLLSQVEFSSQRVSGSRLQLADQVGIGVRFGERRRHDLGLRLQHLSNSGVEKPNPGMNFGVLRYQYAFD